MFWRLKICAAPTVLGPVVRFFPALSGWVNLWRAYGAHEEKEPRRGRGGEASSRCWTFRNVRPFMGWHLFIAMKSRLLAIAQPGGLPVTLASYAQFKLR